MKRFVVAGICIAVVVISGCSKKEPANRIAPVQKTQANVPKQEPSADVAGSPDAPPAIESTSTGGTMETGQKKSLFPPPIHREFVLNGKVDLEALTATMRDWCYWTNRFPTNLEELVNTGYVPSLPEPPAGQKYRINEKLNTVELVKK